MVSEPAESRARRSLWAAVPGWRAFVLDPATILGVCLIVAVVTRLSGIQTVHTSDEALWMARSMGFGAALTRGDFESTYQSGHPGVTVMWTGALGIGRERLVAFLSAGFPTLDAAEKTRGYLDLFGAARQAMAIVTAVLVTVVVGLAWRLLGREAGLLGGVLLLLDPYVTGMTRLLHVDALLAPLMAISALAVLIWWQGGRWPYLLLSGMSGGLALLTKAPAAYLPIYVGLGGGLVWFALGRSGGGLRRWIVGGVVWGALSVVVYAALWPAMWVEPYWTLVDVAFFARTVGGQPHGWPNFFLGEPTILDPGPALYPLALAYRLGPLASVGLIGLLIVALTRRRVERAVSVLGMVLYVVGFVLLMTVGDKKFDRYMLPALVMLDLLAGVGVWEVVRRVAWRPLSPAPHVPSPPGRLLPTMGPLPSGLPTALGAGEGELWPLTPRPPLPHAGEGEQTGRVWPGMGDWISWGAVAALIAVQAVFCWWAYPYPLAAYNPLLGGEAAARQAILVGWGEGLDQAAAYLNGRPDADRLVVATLYHHALRPMVVGRTVRIGEPDPLDYFVVYVNMAQRELIPAPIRQVMDAEPPEFTAWVNGQPYVWVYRVPPGLQVPTLDRPAEGQADQ